jgi:hypothetical protein
LLIFANGRAMAQDVSRRPLTAEARVCGQVGFVHVGFVVDKVALRFFSEFFSFPLSV